MSKLVGCNDTTSETEPIVSSGSRTRSVFRCILLKIAASARANCKFAGAPLQAYASIERKFFLSSMAQFTLQCADLAILDLE